MGLFFNSFFGMGMEMGGRGYHIDISKLARGACGVLKRI